MKRLLYTILFVLCVYLPVCAQMTDYVLEADSIASTYISEQRELNELNDFAEPQSQDFTLLQRVENWYADNMNYWSITALMAVESSFIPFPSEVVIPPAAYVASHPESSLNVSRSYPLNVLIIIIFGTLVQ